VTAEQARATAALHHLVQIHDMFRANLRALRAAADEWAAGTGPAGAVRALTGGDLRGHCLYFCGGLTMHHTMEDRAMFPALLGITPELDAVIARLQADHHEIHGLLDELRRLAEGIGEPGTAPADAETAAAIRAQLDRMATDLEDHLDREERAVGPYLGRLGFL
jgi:iron-sulfur cluster repair protein YtfE (RIC family)